MLIQMDVDTVFQGQPGRHTILTPAQELNDRKEGQGRHSFGTFGKRPGVITGSEVRMCVKGYW